MGVKTMGWAFDQPLSGHRKVVLLALANDANDQTGLCWPGQKRIAAMAGICERTARTILKELEDGGYIARTRRERENGSRTSDLITLNMAPARIAGRPVEEGTPTGTYLPGGTGNMLPGQNQKKEPEESPSGDSYMDSAQDELVIQDPPRPRWKAKLKKVPQPVADLLPEVWSDFIEVTGTRHEMLKRGTGELSDGARLILDRMIENPAMTREEHRRMIELTVKHDPYWTKDGQRPRPAHFYTSKSFEVCRQFLDPDWSPSKNPPSPPARPRAKRKAAYKF